ncbi:hypothetical protein Tco_1044859 [Tanacetum coccineum]|uniref:Uncharacterized protein n=1 Tax=Tanacetum coccineum TaxID=301880 RepID=A0ABQ5GS70_9ASTR
MVERRGMGGSGFLKSGGDVPFESSSRGLEPQPAHSRGRALATTAERNTTLRAPCPSLEEDKDDRTSIDSAPVVKRDPSALESFTYQRGNNGLKKSFTDLPQQRSSSGAKIVANQGNTDRPANRDQVALQRSNCRLKGKIWKVGK